VSLDARQPTLTGPRACVELPARATKNETSRISHSRPPVAGWYYRHADDRNARSWGITVSWQADSQC
jgi:hypothetical protein